MEFAKRTFILFILFFSLNISIASAETITGACSYECSKWSACFNGVQTRSCRVTVPISRDLCRDPETRRTCGACSAEHYGCVLGSSIDNEQGASSWTWSCKGDGDGSDVKCSQPFPVCKYDCTGWSSCSGNTQTRSCSVSNKPCVGGNTPALTKVCGANDISCDPDTVRREWTRVFIPKKEWKDGMYGNGRFLIYDNSGNILTSSDGKSWSSYNADCGIKSIIFAEGKFIGSCYGNKSDVKYVNNDYLMVSVDGINWQYKVVDGLNKLAYGNGLYVSTDGLISKNGYDWTKYTDPYSRTYINDIAYGNGMFIMSGGGNVMLSKDGINWQTHRIGNNIDWDQISYGNGLFFGVERHYNISMSSPDGINWKKTEFKMNGVSYVNGIFLGATKQSLNGNILVSKDGVKWTGEIAPQGNAYFGYSKFIYGDGVYVALGEYNGNTEADFLAVSENKSEDCGNPTGSCVAKKGVWKPVSGTTKTYYPRYDTANNFASGNGTTVVVTNGIGCEVNGIPTLCVMTSKDGFSWSHQSVPLTMKNVTTTMETNYPYELETANIVNFANGQFYLFGSYVVAKSEKDITNYPSVFTSKDGVTWTRHQGSIDIPDYGGIYDAVYGNNRFLAIGANKNKESLLMVSTDGINWKAKKTSVKLNDIIFGNGIFLGYNAKNLGPNKYSYDIYSSTDGFYWKIAKADFPYKWERITYGNGKFVAVSQNKDYKVFSSTDGVDWDIVDSPISCPGAIAYGDGLFVAAKYDYFGGCYGPSTMSSTDGIEWVTEEKTSDMSFRDVGFVKDSFIAISEETSPTFFMRREKFEKVDTGCGSSNGKAFSSFPETGLCTNGVTPTGKTGTSNGWTWKCCEKDCSASISGKKINGVCGSSDGGTFSNAPDAGLCSSGTPTAVKENGGWDWECKGINGGNNDSCHADKGTSTCKWVCSDWSDCNNGKQTRSCNIGSGCSSDNPPDMERICTKNGLSCGSSSGGSFSSKPSTGLCVDGKSLVVVDGGLYWYWICKDYDTDDAILCSAKKATEKVDGVCGLSDKKSLSSMPSTGLCEKGVASPVYGNGPWIWICNGSGGGKLSVCYSLKK